MCGIVGVYSNDPLSPERRLQVAAALKLLAHRGPDGASQKSFGRVVLGHTRLAVVDMSTRAAQPFCVAGGRWWITWNGEIYNYQELRLELEALGHRFETLSDTEVLLKAYLQWGERCQQRLNGMWSLAVFNRPSRTLFLSRDRFGIKPLYWARMGGEFFFASELKPLLCFGISRDPNWGPIRRFLRDGIVPEGGEETVLKEVSSLPPGHCLSVSPDGPPRIERWWRLASPPTMAAERCFADRAAHFGHLVEDSVRLRARNDVPTAVSLSGGVDSASVYGACCKLSREGALRCASDGSNAKELQACSVIYPGSEVNEQRWIEACLEKWDGRKRFMAVTPASQDFPKDIEEIVQFQEAPVWSPAIFALHTLYRRVGQTGIRVVLEGHGADEMLGGYPALVKNACAELIAAKHFADAAIAFHCLVGVHSVPGSIIGFSKLRGVMLASRDLWGLARQRLPGRRTNGRQPSVADAAGTFFTRDLLANRQEPDPVTPGGSCDFDSALREAFGETILPFFLRVFDRATMAYGIESCPPFLDHRLVEYAFSLPMTDKLGHLSKRILREAGRDWLPDCVRNRNGKTPFTAPLTTWFNSAAISEYLADTFSSADALSSGCIRARRVLNFIHARRRGRFSYGDVRRLWPVLNLYLWDRDVCRSRKRYERQGWAQPCRQST